LLPGDFPDEQIEELDGELIDEIDAEIRDYRPNPGHLSTGNSIAEETLVSNLLKTNCPLTGQPDWASIQIRYKGPRFDRKGLLKYLVSFRQHGGFHEHCTESIFMDLMHRCRPERLTVYARYTRRGGLDINPFRTNCGDAVPPNRRTARQ
jgi:7-cyano-7-deazaguanine reductase